MLTEGATKEVLYMVIDIMNASLCFLLFFSTLSYLIWIRAFGLSDEIKWSRGFGEVFLFGKKGQTD